MSKVLIHLAYPLWRKNALVAVAHARELQDQGDDVTVTYCAARGGSCACNLTGNPMVCGMCRSAVRSTVSELGLHSIALAENRREPASDVDVSISDRKELLEGVLSGLISTFRILPADIKHHPILRALKRRSYQTARQLLVEMRQLMAQHRPDRFEVFNGRHACSKFGLLAAKNLSVPFNTMEVTAQKRPILFQGHTAHDRQGVQARILKLPVDLELAESFFSNRRKPRGNKFAKRHSSKFVLPSRDGFQRLVTIFLSSQDEFASLGKSWKSTFPEDHEIVRRTCERFPNTLFCVRFHPNQAGIKSDITSQFEQIQHLPNVHIYYPDDDANSYALIEHSDVVVVFNSTVAVEACWVGKPTIMLGPSFYDELDIAFTPEDVDGFWELLQRDHLPAKDRTGAARLAYYLMRDGDDLKYLRQDDGDLVENGFRRPRAWRSVIARHTSTVCSEIVKLFVRSA